MFNRLENKQTARQLTFMFDGCSYSAAPGMSVAAALLSEGQTSLRKTPVSGSARGPFCMMGVCYDCLVSVNGVTVQACQTLVTEGLVVYRVAVNGEGDR